MSIRIIDIILLQFKHIVGKRIIRKPIMSMIIKSLSLCLWEVGGVRLSAAESNYFLIKTRFIFTEYIRITRHPLIYSLWVF